MTRVQIPLLVVCLLCISAPGQELPSARENRYRAGRRGTRAKESTGVNSTQETEGEELADDLSARTILLLQRLNDRLTALHALDEQQLRRLETLEYRLTKLEVQLQEKSDGVKTELREVTRRVQQLDWQSSKMDATLEAIKLDTSGLNQGQEHLRGMLSGSDSRVPSLVETELQSKMHMIAAAMHVVRGTTANIQNSMMVLSSNVTKLNNMTGNVVALGDKLVSKQHLKTVLLDMKQCSPRPVSTVPAAVEEQLPIDCKAVQNSGHNQSGLYKIKPPLASQPFFAYCDMETRGGGWTVLQNRYEGAIDFYRDWEDYKRGFGNLGGEFWLGLEKIHILTNYKINELLIELQDFTLTNSYAYYMAFAIGTEYEGYPIQLLGEYDGNAGDSFVYHAGEKFSTYDMDNDGWQGGNCAESHTGAWWYKGCDTSNLNGRYLGGEVTEGLEYQGMYWYDWRGPLYSLMKTRISVRPSIHSHATINNTWVRKPKTQKKNPTTTTRKTTQETATDNIEEYDY